MTAVSAPKTSALALLAALLAVPAHARAADGMAWTEAVNGSLASLAYGPPDASASPLFLLSCFSDLGVAVLDVHKEIAGSASGDKLTIELSAGNAKSPIDGEAASEEDGGKLFAEASDVRVKPILAVLGEPGPATIKIGEISATLSDQGRVQAVEQFKQNCLID